MSICAAIPTSAAGANMLTDINCCLQMLTAAVAFGVTCKSCQPAQGSLPSVPSTAHPPVASAAAAERLLKPDSSEMQQCWCQGSGSGLPVPYQYTAAADTYPTTTQGSPELPPVLLPPAPAAASIFLLQVYHAHQQLPHTPTQLNEVQIPSHCISPAGRCFLLAVPPACSLRPCRGRP